MTPGVRPIVTRAFAVVLVACLALVAPTGSEAVSDSPPAENADGVWQRLPAFGSGPSPRSTPAVASIRDSIYVFGGVHDDFRTQLNTFYNDLYRYDTADDHWSELSPAGPVPAPRAFAASAADQASRTMYLFGGASYGPGFAGFIAYDDLWAYSADRNAWTRLRPVNAGPAGRSRPNMWLVGQRLYVFGGATSPTFETLNDLWVYDIAANRWTELIPNGAPGSPPTRHEAVAGVRPVNGMLPIYSGERVDLAEGVSFEQLADTWQYDLATRRWTEVTPAVSPSQQAYGSAAVLNQRLYLHGGELPGGSSGCGAPFPQHPTEQLWAFDQSRGAWQRLRPAGDPLPALKRTNAAVAGGRMYVFAGFGWQCDAETDPGQIWNTDVYAYQPGRRAQGAVGSAS